MIDTQEILSDLNIHNKYAKYIPEKQRRENWEEIIDRNKKMHIEKFPQLKEEIDKAYELVYDKKILPSMRSLQFAGKPIEVNPSRIYNCSAVAMDNYKAFGEVMFLALGGVGTGISVQKHHIEKLPPIRTPLKTKRYLISDAIEGWANAVNFLIKAYLSNGAKPLFDFRDIRPKGARLVTAGGKAPGAAPLKICLAKIESILDEKKDGEQLKSIEVHDIVCHILDAVLAGGIRRSSCISLFSFSDIDMLQAKHGNWYELNPQRGRANNSVVLMRSKIKKEDFDYIWKIIKDSNAGEPGLFFTNDKEILTNPCCFTGDTLIAVADGRNAVSIKMLCDENKSFPVYSAYWAKNHWKAEIQMATVFKTGHKKIIEIILSDGSSFKCTPDHLLATENGEWVEAQYSIDRYLGKFYSFSDKNSNKNYRIINSKSNGYSRQYRKIIEFLNPEYDSNIHEIDHIDGNASNDLISNLEFLKKEEHKIKSNDSKKGTNNAYYKMKNPEKWSILQSIHTTKENLIKANRSIEYIENYINEKFGEIIIPETEDSNVYLDERVYVIDIKITNEIEDIYDLTVEENHNFYIITKIDDNRYMNCSGVLVHNCEVSLRSASFCNLCEVNASSIISQEDLNERVRAASFIATLQASYTDFHFLRSIWKKNSEDEALIGVGLTGIADGEVLQYSLKEAAEIVKLENERVANLIGINKARRCNVIKPSGNSSICLKTSSGIHSRFAPYYWRRMRIGKNESIYTYLLIYASELLEEDKMNKSMSIVKVAVQSPKHSIYRNENVISFLERIKLVSEEWIRTGHRKGTNYNNVSATINIKDDEWSEVGNWMWHNKEFYNGLSVIPYDGGSYIQMPYEECTEQDYLNFCDKIKDVKINLDDIIEYDDKTDFSAEVACSGGKCEIV